MLHEFYAVTITSVYHVRDRRSESDPSPVARKIALKRESAFGVGQELGGGIMIAITTQLQAYIPEGCGVYAPCSQVERRIEMVNTGYWGAHSSHIVALFITEEKALACLESELLVPCDRRWLEDTKNVLEEIGEDHSSFYVCKWGPLNLMANVA